MTETAYMKRLQLAAARAGTILHRFNVGKAWQGKRCTVMPDGSTIPQGYVLLRGARFVDFGPPEGHSDLAGLQPMVITPDDVGRTLGIYIAVETKGNRTRVTAAQQKFLNMVRQNGGIARLMREPEEWHPHA